jgi:tetratricopeptide (TPR) repeat protein
LSERKQFQEATDEGKLAVHYEPDSDFAHYALAKVFFDRDRFTEALQHINEAVRLDASNPQNYSLLAAIHFNQHRWKDCLDAAERGLQMDSEHVGCTNLRAMALVKLGRRQEAGATIDAALARNPENSMTHANQGWTLLESGDHKKALEHFRESLRLNPENEWARQGIVESLKAKHLIYSWMLRYFLWMSKLSPRAQWGVILGAYFGNRILYSVSSSNPQLAPWILPVKILYLIFVVLTWTASPLFNLLLRLNRFGRLALSREQIIASNCLGVTIFLALVSIAGWLTLKDDRMLLSAVVFGFLALPVTGIFKCRAGWPRTAMGAYTLALLAIGLLTLFTRSGLALIGIFILGVFLSGWIVNGLMMARPKR